MLSQDENHLFRILSAANELLPQVSDGVGRQQYPEVSIVGDNNDSVDLRRVSTASEAKGGKFRGDYEMRTMPFPFFDPPMPRPGMSGVSQAFSGNPHDKFSGGVLQNEKNPPFSKENPIDDCWWLVPGNDTKQVNGTQLLQIGEDCFVEIIGNLDVTIEEQESRRIEGDYSVSGGATNTIGNDAGVIFKQFEDGSFFVKNNSGAGVFFSKEGIAMLRDAFNNQIVLGGAGSVSPEGKLTPSVIDSNVVSCEFTADLRLNLNGRSVHIENASDVTIAGKTAATVGARDTDGDSLIDSGWS